MKNPDKMLEFKLFLQLDSFIICDKAREKYTLLD